MRQLCKEFISVNLLNYRQRRDWKIKHARIFLPQTFFTIKPDKSIDNKTWQCYDLITKKTWQKAGGVQMNKDEILVSGAAASIACLGSLVITTLG